MSKIILSNVINDTFIRLKDELHLLYDDEEWVRLKEGLKKKLFEISSCTEEGEQLSKISELFELLQSNLRAQERFRFEILVVKLKNELVRWASILNIEADYINSITEEVATALATELGDNEKDVKRVVTLQEHGQGPSKSIKFRNLKFELCKFSIFTVAALSGLMYQIIKEPHPLIIAAGILLIIGNTIENCTIKISEQDSSVFWGIIKTCNVDSEPSENLINKITNKEREKIGLDPLSIMETKKSLYTLRTIGAVDKLNQHNSNKWQIIEKYKIKH